MGRRMDLWLVDVDVDLRFPSSSNFDLRLLRRQGFFRDRWRDLDLSKDDGRIPRASSSDDGRLSSVVDLAREGKRAAKVVRLRGGRRRTRGKGKVSPRWRGNTTLARFEG